MIASSNVNSWPYSWPNFSNTALPQVVTSGPMPSPGITNMCFFIPILFVHWSLVHYSLVRFVNFYLYALSFRLNNNAQQLEKDHKNDEAGFSTPGILLIL